jgi:hypothetical protein
LALYVDSLALFVPTPDLGRRLWHLYVSKPHSACINQSFLWFSYAYCDEHTHECNVDCNFQTQSVIYTRRVLFPHAECDLYTQSVISTRSVILKCKNVIKTLTTVVSKRTRVISTRRVWFWDVWAWLRHTRVWFTHAQVEFQLDTCDFRTNQLKLRSPKKSGLGSD